MVAPATAPPGAPPLPPPRPPFTTPTPLCDQSDYNQNILIGYASLAVLCLCSWKVAAFVSDNKRSFSLPRGSGFLITGLLAGGSFNMNFVKANRKECVISLFTHQDGSQYDELQAIFFPINFVCLAFIAFATGAELRIERYRKLLKKMSIISATIVFFVFVTVTGSMVGLLQVGDFFPVEDFAQPGQDPADHDQLRLAVAILFGSILTSRSPASAISIIGEMRAKGVYTQLSLGVTIFIYVIANVLFPICDSLASVAAGNAERVGVDMSTGFISLVLSAVVGIAMGLLMYAITGAPIRLALKHALHIRSPSVELYIKASLSLGLGFASFFLRLVLDFYQQETAIRGANGEVVIGQDNKPEAEAKVKLTIVPLLTCLAAGVTVTNFRKCKRADAFARMCKSVAPYVYSTFFTLVGASIDFQADRLGIAITLVVMRIIGVVIGAHLGGFLAREPFSRTRLAPLNFITQAGVALGFAEEVRSRASQSSSWLYNYPGLGEYVFNVVAMAVVCNQLIGPPAYKLALRWSGDAFIDRIGGAQLVTVEGQSPQIRIKKLPAWEVRAGIGGSRVAKIVPGEGPRKLCRSFDENQLPPLLGDPGVGGPASNYPFVCMLEDDAANFEACKLAQRLYGVRRCIVQQIDPAWKAKFNEIGGLVLDPDAIVIEPLTQLLSSAQSANLLLHQDALVEVVRVHVDMKAAGMTLGQCGFPKDVQVLEIRRKAGGAIVPRAFTKVMVEDQLLLCGSPSSLADVTAIQKGLVLLVPRARGNTARRREALVEETTVILEVSPFADDAIAHLHTHRASRPGSIWSAAARASLGAYGQPRWSLPN